MGALKARYVARQMCSKDDSDALNSWIILDTSTGLPLVSNGSIRTFEKEQMMKELEKLNENSVSRQSRSMAKDVRSDVYSGPKGTPASRR